jgi:hypothetical protein
MDSAVNASEAVDVLVQVTMDPPPANQAHWSKFSGIRRGAHVARAVAFCFSRSRSNDVCASIPSVLQFVRMDVDSSPRPELLRARAEIGCVRAVTIACAGASENPALLA